MPTDRGNIAGSATGAALAVNTVMGRIPISQDAHAGRVIAALIAVRSTSPASSVTSQINVGYESTGTVVTFPGSQEIAAGANAENAGASWSIGSDTNADGVHLTLILNLPATTLDGVVFVGGGEWLTVTSR